MIHLGYNDTRLKRHEIFGPFYDVVTEFDCSFKTSIPMIRRKYPVTQVQNCTKCGFLCVKRGLVNYYIK